MTGRLLKFFVLGLVIVNIFLASWYVLHQDLYFHSDIARDFLLLDEISDKKIVLIGQRAGVDQLFHGPLWLYLNFPAYYFSNGNPVAVGWFWIFLIVVFLTSSFFIARDLLNEAAAYLFVLMLSTYLISHAKDMSHPMGALFVMPALFWVFLKYVRTLAAKYLAMLVLLVGVLLQFEMAEGIPFLILSFGLAIFLIIKNKKWPHLFTFFLLLLPLSTFILFDVRHEFGQFHGIVKFLRQGGGATNYLDLIWERVNFITTAGTSFLLVFKPSWKLMDLANRLISVTFFVMVILMIRQKVQRNLLLLFLYFFFGFFILVSIRHGALLIHQALSLVPLVFLAFSALILTKFRRLIIFLAIIIIFANEIAAIDYVRASADFRGKSEDSWNFLHNMASRIFESTDFEFGYFTYSPDAFSYQSKYAMVYGRRKFPGKKVYYFEKKPVTYLVLAPAPINDPWAKYFKASWWTENTIRIHKEPQSAVDWPNGYRVEKYELTPEEIAVPFDITADTGIHFR